MVMHIAILPQDVASRIAAGEVIERPASVVKELVENSLDAGATDIKVEVLRGGRRLSRVIDDGHGIPALEAELAFERYATSKLKSIDDLSGISTLGFRGEALRSIAAVSQVTMVTRAESEAVGNLLRLEGGQLVLRETTGGTPGTVVTVENLFYNTPARLKFMRSAMTESRYISELVASYAMAYPRVRFSLLQDGRKVFQSKGSGSLYDVLVDVYGLEIAQQMLEVQEDSVGSTCVSVTGFVSGPLLHRSSSRNLTMLVNGRWVRDRVISHAIREAYHSLLPKGRHPIVVLRADLPGDQVDVNVHPAKSEVRFRDTGAVYSSVQKAVRRALSRRAMVPADSTSFTWERVVEERERRLVGIEDRYPATAGALALELQRTTAPSERFVEAPSRDKLPMLRVLGQLGRTYIIAEGPTGMYLVDQHAAHERVLYERFEEERSKAAIATQTLVEPVVIDEGPGGMWEDGPRLERLRELGFDVEPFGSGALLVRAVPAVLGVGDIRKSVTDILEEMQIANGSQSAADAAVISLACHGAIRSGQTLGLDEMRALVVQLEQTRLPRTCPHGRPTMLHVSAERLEKEFGRR
jgi:DNA mismatch repair protein MutL